MGGEVCGFNKKSKSGKSGNTVFVLANSIISHQTLVEDLHQQNHTFKYFGKGTTWAPFPRLVVLESIFRFCLKACYVSLARAEFNCAKFN